MAFKLPKLTWELDCEPLGYPGLTVTLVLNPDLGEYRAPWADTPEGAERERARRQAPPWESEYYWGLGRVIETVTVPAVYTAGGQEETIAVDSARAVYELERARGFDPQILQWALRQYADQRQERLRIERKN